MPDITGDIIRRSTKRLDQIRPGHYAAWLLLQERLSRKAPANCLLRRKAKQESGFLDQQFHASGTNHHRDLPKRWQIELFFKWIKQHLRIKAFLLNIRECGQNTNMDCYLRLRAGCNYQKAIESRAKPQHNFTIVSVTLFEKISLLQALTDVDVMEENTDTNNQLNLFD